MPLCSGVWCPLLYQHFPPRWARSPALSVSRCSLFGVCVPLTTLRRWVDGIIVNYCNLHPYSCLIPRKIRTAGLLQIRGFTPPWYVYTVIICVAPNHSRLRTWCTLVPVVFVSRPNLCWGVHRSLSSLHFYYTTGSWSCQEGFPSKRSHWDFFMMTALAHPSPSPSWLYPLYHKLVSLSRGFRKYFYFFYWAMGSIF
jgi:hypothetical protein